MRRTFAHFGTGALCLALAGALPAQPAPPPAAPPAGNTAPATAAPAAPAAPPVSERDAALAAALPPDQVLWLQADNRQFLARYIADLTGEARGSAILLHDSGHHPSWPFTVAALIDDLPLHGWNTLSIELPTPAQQTPAAVTETAPAAAQPAAANAAAPAAPAQPAAPAGAAQPAAQQPQGAPAAAAPPGPEQQAQARIAAAVAHLVDQKQSTIALIGFGSGAYRAAEFVRQLAAGGKGTGPIRFLVLVAPLDHPPAVDEPLPKLLPATTLPTLDLILSSSRPAREEAEQRRRAVLRQRDRIYQQLELPPLAPEDDAEHSLMVKRVRGFLQQRTDKPNLGSG